MARPVYSRSFGRRCAVRLPHWLRVRPTPHRGRPTPGRRSAPGRCATSGAHPACPARDVLGAGRPPGPFGIPPHRPVRRRLNVPHAVRDRRLLGGGLRDGEGAAHRLVVRPVAERCREHLRWRAPRRPRRPPAASAGPARTPAAADRGADGVRGSGRRAPDATWRAAERRRRFRRGAPGPSGAVSSPARPRSPRGRPRRPSARVSRARTRSSPVAAAGTRPGRPPPASGVRPCG